MKLQSQNVFCQISLPSPLTTPNFMSCDTKQYDTYIKAGTYNRSLEVPDIS